MSDQERRSRPGIPTSLAKAVNAWALQGDANALDRWMTKELDDDGSPIRLALADWSSALDSLVRAREARPGWPNSIDVRLLASFRMLLRFSRPDGHSAMGTTAPEEADEALQRLGRLGDAFPGSDADRVLGWWIRGREVEPAPPPLPAWSSPDRAMGVLRADWTPRGEFVAFDHRSADGSTRFEVFGAGRSWLGDSWTGPGDVARASVGKPSTWTTGAKADVAEWTFRAGSLRVDRTVLMLRGLKLAILADLVEGIKSPTLLEIRWGMPPALLVEPVAESRAFLVRPEAVGSSAQAIPLGLPALSYPTDRGQFVFEPGSRGFVLSQAVNGSAAWLPLLISWDHARHRKRLHWRVLTVSENYRACPPGTAWAARVSWGRSETYVIYRSLGPTARRSFLGYSTSDATRLLVGRFTTEGAVEPIVALDGP